jgi:transcriptional regulator with XRE-family HTH domain
VTKIFNAALLKELRTADGINQKELSEKIGWHKSGSQVSVLESGKVKEPTTNTVKKLSVHFNVPAQDFWIENSGKPKTHAPKKTSVKVKSNSEPVGSVDPMQAAKEFASALYDPSVDSGLNVELIDSFSNGDLLLKFSDEFYRATKL